MQVPLRVYVPEQAKAGEPMPLVIVLHGAGADENAWFEAMGAGEIKRLADKHGFIVVSPNTYWVMPNPNGLKGIVETMSVEYAIDPSRVYVIGHSLGSMAAAGHGDGAPDALAGAVLIAGGSIPPDAAICPDAARSRPSWTRSSPRTSSKAPPPARRTRACPSSSS